MVMGWSDLERQAAVLSKSRGRRPVALQRAAQQCLSQHINNSYMLECVYASADVHTHLQYMGPFLHEAYVSTLCGSFMCLSIHF